MTRDEIRLECLKLAHRHDRAPADVVKVATEYEKYLQGQPETKTGTAEKKIPGKNVGNS